MKGSVCLLLVFSATSLANLDLLSGSSESGQVVPSGSRPPSDSIEDRTDPSKASASLSTPPQGRDADTSPVNRQWGQPSALKKRGRPLLPTTGLQQRRAQGGDWRQALQNILRSRTFHGKCRTLRNWMAISGLLYLGHYGACTSFTSFMWWVTKDGFSNKAHLLKTHPEDGVRLQLLLDEVIKHPGSQDPVSMHALEKQIGTFAEERRMLRGEGDYSPGLHSIERMEKDTWARRNPKIMAEVALAKQQFQSALREDDEVARMKDRRANAEKLRLDAIQAGGVISRHGWVDLDGKQVGSALSVQGDQKGGRKMNAGFKTS